MRIGVLDDVQPVSRPAFTIVFRPEQSIDQFFIGLGICVINELLNLFVSRWKSDQVVGHSANQRATVSRLRTSQSFLIQLVENELVDCGLCPRMIDLGNWWADQRPVRPPIKVIDTRFLVNPGGFFAPASIHFRITAISSAVSGSASLGISAFPSFGVMRSTR